LVDISLNLKKGQCFSNTSVIGSARRTGKPPKRWVQSQNLKRSLGMSFKVVMDGIPEGFRPSVERASEELRTRLIRLSISIEAHWIPRSDSHLGLRLKANAGWPSLDDDVETPEASIPVEMITLGGKQLSMILWDEIRFFVDELSQALNAQLQKSIDARKVAVTEGV
jgi:hypothetical protein